ncbi:hypothetical protein [Flavobacterium aquiphilum]|uniref:hypothetical protein n=1 Tax=Flavobacterium aquiphilum TaxID=3003261 RepID=UPI0024815568|nr:hypothetical protein [Flavobacterium aquiphilum]
MKKIITKVFLIIAFLYSSIAFTQGINKVSLLNELNKTYGVTLNADEQSNFENANNTLVSELFALEEKNLSKENRDKQIDKLFDKRDKALTSSLGINKYSDIKSQTGSKTAETVQKVKASKMTP